MGSVLDEVLDSYIASCELNGVSVVTKVLERVRAAVKRLSGFKDNEDPGTMEGFVDKEFTVPSTQKLPVEQAAVPIIDARLDEVRRAMAAGAHLSVVIVCGSILEAVLLGKAQKVPAKFNSARGAPTTRDSKVKPFQDWSLAQLIDVSSELGILKPDDEKGERCPRQASSNN